MKDLPSWLPSPETVARHVPAVVADAYRSVVAPPAQPAAHPERHATQSAVMSAQQEHYASTTGPLDSSHLPEVRVQFADVPVAQVTPADRQRLLQAFAAINDSRTSEMAAFVNVAAGGDASANTRINVAYREIAIGMDAYFGVPAGMPPISDWSENVGVASREAGLCIRTLEEFHSAWTALTTGNAAEAAVAAIRLGRLVAGNENLRAFLGDSAGPLVLGLGRAANGHGGGVGADLLASPAVRALVSMSSPVNCARVEAAFGAINQGIYYNVAPYFSRFQSAEAAQPGSGAAALRTSGAPDRIVSAFEAYQRAAAIPLDSDANICAYGEAMLEGNLAIAEYEQLEVVPQLMQDLERHDPGITMAVDALSPLIYAPVGEERRPYLEPGRHFSSDYDRTDAARGVIQDTTQLEVARLRQAFHARQR